MMPQNGNISCDGEHVTDTTCVFECDLGYGLVGPFMTATSMEPFHIILDKEEIETTRV